MAAIAKFVLPAITVLAAVHAAPFEKSSLLNLSNMLKSVMELITVVEEYRSRFEKLNKENDQLLTSSRSSVFTSIRLINEQMLNSFGKTWHAIKYGFNETRKEINDKLLSGGDENCLLQLVSLIEDKQQELAASMSECANASNQEKDKLVHSFYELLDLLHHISTGLTNHILWSFGNYNSFKDPVEHANSIRRSFIDAEQFWRDQVVAYIEFELYYVEYYRPILVEENLRCLDLLVSEVRMYDANIRYQISTCVAPLND